jgi:hypothetical protein
VWYGLVLAPQSKLNKNSIPTTAALTSSVSLQKIVFRPSQLEILTLPHAPDILMRIHSEEAPIEELFP